jgi:hypothetical protein
MARGPVIVTALASFAIGLAIGLTIAWVLWPVQYTNADPADLRQAYKDDYVRMISAAYQRDGNLAKARQRLSQLHLDNSIQTITALIARERQTRPNSSLLTSLIGLGQALVATPVAVRPTPVGTPIPEGTVPPSPPVTTSVPVPAFRLVEQTRLSCSEEPETAHFRVFVRDAQGKDLPNVGIEIRWTNGDETIYTGLKPERGIGYADFEAAPDRYSITILNAQSDPANLQVGEAPANCRNDRGVTPRGWKLIFQQK